MYTEDGSFDSYYEDRYDRISSKVRNEENAFTGVVVKEPFKGHYAIVKAKRYGNESEIVYFERKSKGYYVIKENNLDN